MRSNFFLARKCDRPGREDSALSYIVAAARIDPYLYSVLLDLLFNYMTADTGYLTLSPSYDLKIVSLNLHLLFCLIHEA